MSFEALNYGFVDSIIESQEDAKGAAAKGGFSDGKKKTALYNAATVLHKDTNRGNLAMSGGCYVGSGGCRHAGNNDIDFPPGKQWK